MILVIANSKGGVGKTTLTRDLAGAFVALGRSARLVDMDQQSSLTHGLLGPGALPARVTVAALFDPVREPEPLELVHDVPRVPGLSIVPGSELLRIVDTPAPHHGPNQWALRALLAELPPADVTLVDCPPSLGLCSWCALLAADAVLVPIEPEHYAALALRQTAAMIRHAQAARPIRHLGYVATKVQRLSLHRLYLDELRAQYGDAVCVNTMPRAVEVAECARAGLPVVQYRRRSGAARIALALAGEILQRHERGEQAA